MLQAVLDDPGAVHRVVQAMVVVDPGRDARAEQPQPSGYDSRHHWQEALRERNVLAREATIDVLRAVPGLEVDEGSLGRMAIVRGSPDVIKTALDLPEVKSAILDRLVDPELL